MLKSARMALARLWRRDDGMETVEYAIIVGLIVAACIVVIAAIAMWVLNTLQQAAATMGA
jgi:Flp pilus assembly pilin Flp